MANTAITFVFTYTGADIADGVWFGIVIGQESMTNADMIICWVDTDSSTGCGDFYGATSSVPDADSTTNDVSKFAESVEDGKVEIIATRDADTGDSEDTVLTTDATITYGWAYGPYSSGTLSAATASGSVESKVGNAVYMTLTVLTIMVFGMML